MTEITLSGRFGNHLEGEKLEANEILKKHLEKKGLIKKVDKKKKEE